MFKLIWFKFLFKLIQMSRDLYFNINYRERKLNELHLPLIFKKDGPFHIMMTNLDNQHTIC